MHRSPLLVLASTALVASIALQACGSDDEKAATTTVAAVDTTIAPEDVKVPDAAVTAGLTQMPATIASAIAAIGTPDAKTKLDAIEALWFSFEGTVRDKDATIYLAIEDQLTPLQRQISDGDSATATTTAATLSELFTQYITKYPA